jgi:hypothetical protein
MVSLTLVENPHCTLNVENADNFFVEDEKYRVSAEITNENYVPDCWQIIDAITGEVYHERTWEENPIFEDVATLHDIYSRKEICLKLICTNENLVDTLPVEIISSTGDKVRVEVQKPSKMIAGRGFPLWVTPDMNTYIQDIYKTAPEADDFPYKSEISFTSVQDIYSKGGVVFVPDPTEAYGAECKVVIKAIPREKAAVVHILSDDEFIWEECEATGKKPSGYYAPSIADRTMVVEKNKETLHQLLHLENLNAIYEVGYEFAGVEDKNGNKIADD